LRERPPAGPEWLHEIKADGYRLELVMRDGETRAFTRNGNDWTARFRELLALAASLPARELILDGEVVVQNAKGIADFELLQDDLANGRSGRMVYVAFDLLYLDGYDLRRVPLIERKAILARLLEAPPPRFLYSDHLEADGAEMIARVCEMGLEGIVAKRRDSSYRSGSSDQWLKIACSKRESLPIIGFVPSAAGLVSLYLGRRKGKELLYAGKAGTGFNARNATQLRKRLDPLVSPTSPLTEQIRKPHVTWVRPELIAEVQYRAATSDGRLRHGVFKGLREDLSAPAPAGSEPAPTEKKPPRLRAANIQHLLADAVAPSKDDLRAYWKRVGKDALPYLGERPLTLVRHVGTKIFFHEGPLPEIPRAVHQMTIAKREGGEGVRVWVDSVQGLVALVDMDVVEIHPWNARVENFERPDMMIFDLDPGEGVAWEAVMTAAIELRRMLRGQGMTCWPKATGGKGLHVVVPLDASRTHDQIRQLSQHLAAAFAASNPELYTVSPKRQDRPGKLFIDYLRNGRGQTGVGVYSPRARAGFPIAMRFTWAQVERGLPADAYTMARLP
jgi:bifunctional non-homologous end joining protein LigD